VAIGQGAVTTTPIQIARAVAASVNGGKVLTPYLIRKVTAADGRIIEEHNGPIESRDVGISQSILNRVRDTMVGVVNAPSGTGQKAKLRSDLPFKVGGKTGTAQVISLDHNSKREEFGDHAWFAGYAPADSPEVVAVALIENGGSGGSAAAPVVRSVLEAYFDSSRPTSTQPSESKSITEVKKQ
jgi:penicillin-binding protein 2